MSGGEASGSGDGLAMEGIDAVQIPTACWPVLESDEFVFELLRGHERSTFNVQRSTTGFVGSWRLKVGS
jgi:hypothetical protein